MNPYIVLRDCASGRLYVGYKAAAAAVGVGKSAVRWAVTRGRPIRGHDFEIAGHVHDLPIQDMRTGRVYDSWPDAMAQMGIAEVTLYQLVREKKARILTEPLDKSEDSVL